MDEHEDIYKDKDFDPTTKVADILVQKGKIHQVYQDLVVAQGWIDKAIEEVSDAKCEEFLSLLDAVSPFEKQLDDLMKPVTDLIKSSETINKEL